MHLLLMEYSRFYAKYFSLSCLEIQLTRLLRLCIDYAVKRCIIENLKIKSLIYR